MLSRPKNGFSFGLPSFATILLQVRTWGQLVVTIKVETDGWRGM
jgi:hypothetical protein